MLDDAQEVRVLLLAVKTGVEVESVLACANMLSKIELLN